MQTHLARTPQDPTSHTDSTAERFHSHKQPLPKAPVKSSANSCLTLQLYLYPPCPLPSVPQAVPGRSKAAGVAAEA